MATAQDDEFFGPSPFSDSDSDSPPRPIVFPKFSSTPYQFPSMDFKFPNTPDDPNGMIALYRHKRLFPPSSSGANQESRDTIQESGKQKATIDNGGLSDLELITRSEIDRLTELLHSTTAEWCNEVGLRSTDFYIQQTVSSSPGHDSFSRSSFQETRNEIHFDSHGFHGRVQIAVVSSEVLKEDVATPAELAKAFTGNKSSKVFPSASPSTACAYDLVSRSVSKDTALKRKRFASEVKVCRPQETNLSTPKNMSLPVTRTPFSKLGTGISTNGILDTKNNCVPSLSKETVIQKLQQLAPKEEQMGDKVGALSKDDLPSWLDVEDEDPVYDCYCDDGTHYLVWPKKKNW